MELRSKGVNQSSVSEEEPLDQQTTETDLRKKDTVALAVQIRPRTKANETAGSGGYNRRRPPPNCEKNDGAATPRRKQGKPRKNQEATRIGKLRGIEGAATP